MENRIEEERKRGEGLVYWRKKNVSFTYIDSCLVLIFSSIIIGGFFIFLKFVCSSIFLDPYVILWIFIFPSLGIDDLQIQLPSNTKSDFDNVLATQKPTVSEADLKVYVKFAKEYVLYG